MLEHEASFRSRQCDFGMKPTVLADWTAMQIVDRESMTKSSHQRSTACTTRTSRKLAVQRLSRRWTAIATGSPHARVDTLTQGVESLLRRRLLLHERQGRYGESPLYGYLKLASQDRVPCSKRQARNALFNLLTLILHFCACLSV